MYQQPQLDFTAIVHTQENNRHSNNILEDQYERLNKQCKVVYDLLKKGERLTVRGMFFNYGITSLPRRIKDLKEKGALIKTDMLSGIDENGDKTKYAEYYL